MKLGLRHRLLLAVVPGFLILALLGVVMQNWAIAGLGLLFGGAAAGLIHWLTGPFERLRLAAQDSLRQAGIGESTDAEQVGPQDGTAEIAGAINTLVDQFTITRHSLAERNRQYETSLTSIGHQLQMIARDPRPQMKYFTPESPWGDKNTTINTALITAAQNMLTAQKRSSALLAVINDLAEPILVLDSKLNVQFVNLAAEKHFGHLPNGGLKQPIRNFFTDPPSLDLAGFEPTQCLRASDAINWISQARGGSTEVVGATEEPLGTPFSLSMVPVKSRKGPQSVVLLLRDLTQTKRAEGNSRQLHRRLIGQRISLLIGKEATPSLDVIRTQAGLLAQAAKQAGQRERFVPKVQRILEEVNRQSLVIELLAWLGRLTTTRASEPDYEEVRLRTVVDDVAEKLAPSISERGNTLDVSGDAGWLIADESRVSVMLTGLLIHANTCVERSAITLELRRRSTVNTDDEVGEVIIKFAGNDFPQAFMDDIRDPFRRANSAVFDVSGKGGFLLGPAVAHRVAGLMGGELNITSEAGKIQINVAVPTRERSDNRMTAQVVTTKASDFTPGGDAQDSLADWGMGGKASEADTDDVNQTPVPSYAGDSAPVETIDDSIGSFFGSDGM
ncbi:MAG: hypothetical protein ACRC8S_10510 [Fimbriiglobus sp.]